MKVNANISNMATVRWKLSEFLENNKLTPYRLGIELGGHTRIPAIYKLVDKKNPPTRVDFETLGNIIETLSDLTGKSIGFDDVLEFIPTEKSIAVST